MTEAIQFTTEMAAVLSILLLTICLFAFEIVRVDVAAVIIMVLLGLSALVPGYDGLVDGNELFQGFSSNAVISIIAVMIIGAGLDRTGLMGKLASKILKYGGKTESRVIIIISSVVGIISSFLQNIGAAALFMPVVNRIARRGNLPISRLLMPMGFCAILGGTITMVGSSPLILLNDLIDTANHNLPASVDQMDSFDLFDVTPIGLTLLLSGILYFTLFGRFVLPVVEHKPSESGNMLTYFSEVYGIESTVYECVVTEDSSLVDSYLSDIDEAGRAGWIIAIKDGSKIIVSPQGGTMFEVGTEMAIMGRRKDVEAFADEYNLEMKHDLDEFADILSSNSAGIAEVVIPPQSGIIGKTLAESRIRRRYGATVLSVFRADDVIEHELSQLVIQSGDTLIIHIDWNRLGTLADNRNDFVVVTDFPREDERPDKIIYAALFFAITLCLILFTDLRLSIALMVGAIGMIVSGVIKIDEAYNSIGWQSVFLLASLIPLGVAVQNTGTAAWIASHVIYLLDGLPIWVLQVAVAILATVFTLVMSNVGATVLLVPLAVNIAIGVGASPAMFALTVALSTSNSFLIPTHQVNALIMGPGGYRVIDFLRAGSIMTIMFIFILVLMLNLLF